MFKFELNAKVRETICGLVGIIMGRTEYATGCRSYGVLVDHLDDDGKIPDWVWLDENRLELYSAEHISALQNAIVKNIVVNGGPMPNAPER